MAEAERLNAIARARIPAPLERGEHGNKVVLFKSEFLRMKQAVEVNEDLRVAVANGKQVENDYEDLKRRLPKIIAEAVSDATNRAVQAVCKEYDQKLNMAQERADRAEEKNAALLKENRALKDFIKNNL